MRYAFMRVQCADSDGKIGDFIAPSSGSKQRLSPLFSDLGKLYRWMKDNGWSIDEHAIDAHGLPLFIPWRVSHQER